MFVSFRPVKLPPLLTTKSTKKTKQYYGYIKVVKKTTTDVLSNDCNNDEVMSVTK